MDSPYCTKNFDLGNSLPRPDPHRSFAERQSRAEEPEGSATGDGNAAYGPSTAETRGVNHRSSGAIRPRTGRRRPTKIVWTGGLGAIALG